MRRRAIACALWFGMLPWWLYEAECHYRPWGWWRHLVHNLRYAWAWATWRETAKDWLFEIEANARPQWARVAPIPRK